MAFLQEEQVHIARQIMAIRAHTRMFPQYIRLILIALVAQLKSAAKSMIPEISRDDVLRALIPVPPMEEQNRIVTCYHDIVPYLEAYDISETALCELNYGFPDRLEKSILQMAVQGKLVPQDPADKPAEVLLARIREEKQRLAKQGKIKKDKQESIIFRRDNSHYEKLGKTERCIDDEIPFEVPGTWAWIRLGVLIKIESGKELTAKKMRSGIIPVYGGNGVIGYHSEQNVFKETVVIGRVGYYCGSVHITPADALVTDNAFITSYPEKLIDRGFLVYTLKFMNLGKNHNANRKMSSYGSLSAKSRRKFNGKSSSGRHHRKDG